MERARDAWGCVAHATLPLRLTRFGSHLGKDANDDDESDGVQADDVSVNDLV